MVVGEWNEVAIEVAQARLSAYDRGPRLLAERNRMYAGSVACAELAKPHDFDDPERADRAARAAVAWIREHIALDASKRTSPVLHALAADLALGLAKNGEEQWAQSALRFAREACDRDPSLAPTLAYIVVEATTSQVDLRRNHAADRLGLSLGVAACVEPWLPVHAWVAAISAIESAVSVSGPGLTGPEIERFTTYVRQAGTAEVKCLAANPICGFSSDELFGYVVGVADLAMVAGATEEALSLVQSAAGPWKPEAIAAVRAALGKAAHE